MTQKNLIEAAQARQVLVWSQEAAQARQVLVWSQEAAQARQVLVWGQEAAYTQGKNMGLMVLCEDEAGPYQAIAQAGQAWHEQGVPARMPHEYVRAGTAKLLTLFRPASGELHAKGVTSSANAILHPWLESALTVLLEQHPVLPVLEEAVNQAAWVRWQQDLTVKFTLPTMLPRLRVLLVMDNLAGHKTPSLMLWLVDHGVMPVFTPLGGSWLNMRPRPSSRV